MAHMDQQEVEEAPAVTGPNGQMRSARGGGDAASHMAHSNGSKEVEAPAASNGKHGSARGGGRCRRHMAHMAHGSEEGSAAC
eukprot:gene4092-14193_t